MNCKECGKNTWVVTRKNDTTEFRIVKIGTEGLSMKEEEDGERKTIIRVQAGWQKYKGNWRVEEKKNMKIIGIRCNSCDTMLESKDLEQYELKIADIHKDKGVQLVSTALEKYF